MKLYSRKQELNKTVIKLLCVPVYVKKQYADSTKHKFLFGLFRKQEYRYKKDYYFLGIKLYSKYERYKEIKDFLFNLSRRCENIEKTVRCQDIDQYKNSYLIAKHHEKVFPQFKNIHLGETAVIVGSGPSLLHYKRIKGALHFCVNASFTRVEPDYWFSIDATNTRKYFNELKETKFIKFFGQCVTTPTYHPYRRKDDNTITFIPDCIIEQFPNAYKFYIDNPSLIISRDIEYQPLPDLRSSIFSALYFAIYTGCKKIYIAGCDSTANGYFYNESEQKGEWQDGTVESWLLRSWNIFKNYVEIFHPDVELISINPVRLKGLFRDVYTQSFVDENPQLFKNPIEYLEFLDEVEELDT